MSAEEAAARRDKFRELSAEKTALRNEQFDAQNPGVSTIIDTPNTTTNRSTTTFSTSSTNTRVEAPDSQDEALSQQEEARLDAQPDVVTGGGSRTRTVGVNADGTIVQGSFQETVQNAEPTPSDSPYESQQEQQNEQIAAANPGPEPDPYDNRFSRQEAAAAEAADNESTAETARLNRSGVSPEDDPAAAQAENNASAAGAENDALAAAGAAASEAATKQRAQEQQALQARFNTPANGDWRVRIRLAPNSTYLYNATNPGILAPLKASDGVIFPYTPTISTTYSANYDVTDLTHSNYKGQFYKNSSVGEVAVNGTFTAQDTEEAEYMLAVIHFFRSVTKMFYGQDAERGTPPPLVYLFGLGQYQFNNHPCVVKTFNYSLPNDVDYIRTQPNNYGVNLLNRRVKESNAPSNNLAGTIARIGNAVDKLGNLLNIGALPKFGSSSAAGGPGVAQQAVNNTSNATYVPTKIEIQITLMPIQTRDQVSQQFSLKGFANGDLLRGGFW